MSSSEEDYMSETFLTKCASGKNDMIPGLIKNASEKRAHLILKRKNESQDAHRKKHLPVRVVEAAKREEGLQKSIGSDNKGFALLQKMGYKPGLGIGLKENGTTEPIQVTVKSDRFGLGRATVLKEISEWKAKKRAERLLRHEKECSVDDYRKRLSEKNKENVTKYDLIKSQKMCQELDIQKGIKIPDEPWFWPETVDSENSEDDEEEIIEVQFEPALQLQLLTTYLRECYLYCIWCGTFYNDLNDFTSNCPGVTRDAH